MRYDIVLKNANIYDGSGKDPYIADIGIIDDKISKIGVLSGENEIDVSGLIVSPGFINMLSWSVESLITDGRAMSTILQGVTLEVMGEGFSWGPLNERMKKQLINLFSTSEPYEVVWDTLGEYLQYLEDKGVSTNIASFVGSATIRTYYLGDENRAPNNAELDRMKQLVKEAMEEGAMGLSSALIYPPNSFSSTDELIALAKIVGEYNGLYISHIRSEGQNLENAVDELIKISREAKVDAEIYHLKAAGERNWYKLDKVIDKIDRARNEGLNISTDCYLYTAAGTGLDSCLPPTEGREELLALLTDNRDEIKEAMAKIAENWENLYFEAGPDNIFPMVFKEERLRQYAGKSITEIAIIMNKDPRDVVIDLLLEDKTRIASVYRIMSEDNIKKKLALPYMSFGSDGESVAPEGEILKQGIHPRTYGNFSRLIAKYVREEQIITLQEAIRKLTYLPACNLKIDKRGLIKEGYFADIVIFDFDRIKDNATFDNPHQLSDGMIHVFVNGVQVLKNEKHTGKTPGRFVKGPGYKNI